MNLVTFAEPVTVNMKKSAGAETLKFEAGRAYVLPHSQFSRIMAEQAVSQRCFKISRIENRIPNFNALHKKPGTQRLLLFNGSGGYGDQIMTWPFARILTTYGFEVHVMVDPGNTVCWWNFPWIASLQDTPMQYEHFKMYDYWVMFEGVVNVDEHQDQLHPLDVMLTKVGIDPASVDPKLKVIRPNFTWLEMQSTNAFQGKRLGMFQLCSANPIRSLPPNDSAFLLSKLADRFHNLHWLALYDEFNPDTYKKALQCSKCAGLGRIQVPAPVSEQPMTVIDQGTKSPEECVAQLKEVAKQVMAPPKNEICQKCKGSGTLRPNIQLYNAPVLRELWALTSKSAVVVAPDSMMIHVAGSMDVPCVGLWGLCAPVNRVRYYKNHVPIWKRETCPFSPCFAYGGTFPKYCPPRPNRTVCECLGAVAPENVVEAIKTFVALPPEPVDQL
jgi:hypothetical protein